MAAQLSSIEALSVAIAYPEYSQSRRDACHEPQQIAHGLRAQLHPIYEPQLFGWRLITLPGAPQMQLKGGSSGAAAISIPAIT